MENTTESKIKKRTAIDNTLPHEMREKYPLQNDKNNVEYKLALQYVTFENDYLTTAETRNVLRRCGCDGIAVMHFLREKMCLDGYKTRVDSFYLDDLCEKAAFDLFLTIDRVKEVYTELLTQKFILEFQDDSGIEDGTFITCPQQIYNFEMANAGRVKSRKSSNKYNGKSDNIVESFDDPTPPEYLNDVKPPDDLFDDEECTIF